MPRSAVAESYDSCMFGFLRKRQAIFIILLKNNFKNSYVHFYITPKLHAPHCYTDVFYVLSSILQILKYRAQFSSVQLLSRVRLFATP